MNFTHFRRRVRMARGWRGLAIGGTFGSTASGCLALLDLFRVTYTSWAALVVIGGAGAVLGLLIGVLLPVAGPALAESIDRRAGLRDRLSAGTRTVQHSSFSEAAQKDAATHLASVKPASVYPIRLSKWHGGLLAGGVLTSSIFLLGNSGILLNSDQKKDRASLQAAAPAVERVAKPLLEKPNRDAEEKSLSEKLLQYEAELQKGRISKQEAMQEANELAKQADELSHHKLEQSQKDATTASQALEKMSQSALEKEGLSQSESGAYKSPEEAQEAEAALQKQIQAIQRQLNEGKGTNGAKLSESEKAALTEKLKQLEHQLELSQKAKEFLDRLSQNPEWKKLQEMMAKSAGMCRNPGSMSDEDLKKMIAALEKMADQYKTDEEISKMLKEMEEALKNAGQGQQLGDMANMLMGLMQSPGMYGNPGPGNGQELYFANLHKIPLSDKPSDIKAKAIPLGVTGDRQQAGSETYIDTKGPSGLGSKTKVPFTAVLQQYRHEAEKALDKDQIPPEDQERVKDYFDSLQENK